PVASLYSDVCQIRPDVGGRFMECSIRRPVRDLVAVVAAMTVLSFAGATRGFAQGGSVTADADIRAAVMKQIANLDYGGRRPTVAVAGGVIMLSGTVSSLWLKE